MTRFTRVLAIGSGLLIALSATPRAQQASAGAQEPGADRAEVAAIRAELARLRTEIDELRRQYDDRLQLLEQRLQQIGGGPFVAERAPAAGAPAAEGSVAEASPAEPPPAGAPEAGAPQAAGQASALPTSGQVFNPDTSVIGNFLANGGRNVPAGEPTFSLAEAEVSFQAVIDPYARGDFYLSAGPDGLEVEEGYATFTSLPANLLVKAGKMRAQFGKVNTLHTHAMPTADRPLVTQNLLGGEEGLSDSGVSVSHLIDNPWLFLEATGEVFAGRSDVFQSTAHDRLAYVGHVRAYQDLSEDRNLEVGASYAFGPTAGDPVLEGLSLDRHLFGIDATFRYRPLRRAIYNRLNVRSELIWSRQHLPRNAETTAFGAYLLGEYQFARRWYVGGRLDRSARALDGSLVDTGGSVFLTFWPTEFSQLRGQYRRTNYDGGVSSDELLFQLNFSIGAHGAHVF